MTDCCAKKGCWRIPTVHGNLNKLKD